MGLRRRLACAEEPKLAVKMKITEQIGLKEEWEGIFLIPFSV